MVLESDVVQEGGDDSRYSDRQKQRIEMMKTSVSAFFSLAAYQFLSANETNTFFIENERY